MSESDVSPLAQQSAILQAALRQKEEEFASIKQRSLELTVALEQARQVPAGTSSIDEICALFYFIFVTRASFPCFHASQRV